MKIQDLEQPDYNPRLITDQELAMLKDSLRSMGDLGGIIRNRTTNNIVGGNQRISIFKELNPDTDIIIEEEYDKPNSQGTIARGYFKINGEKYSYREVIWDDKIEKIAMIAANNIGGGWDIDKLKVILNDLANKVDDISELTTTGFDNNILDDYFNNKQDLERLITAGVLYKNNKDVKFIDVNGVNPPEVRDIVDKTYNTNSAEPEFDENIKTNHVCPKCGYAFS